MRVGGDMRLSKSSFLQTLCWALALSLPSLVVAQDGPRATGDAATRPGAAVTSADSPVTTLGPQSRSEMNTAEELPDSPGAEWAKSQEPASQQTSSSVSAQDDETKTDSQQRTQRPVGTAAAEAPKVTGITAAEPAGVAIAPAKQRRVRTIVLKVGAIVAAGAALGTVVALSAGTSSKPPGAH